MQGLGHQGGRVSGLSGLGLQGLWFGDVKAVRSSRTYARLNHPQNDVIGLCLRASLMVRGEEMHLPKLRKSQQQP